VDFKRVVGNRRTTRFYFPWRPVDPEKIQIVLEAARLASRGVNAAWAKAIVLQRDAISVEQRNQLKDPTTSAQLDLAPIWICWFADLRAVDDAIERETLKELVALYVLPPSHGWSPRYVDSVVKPQVLDPIRNSETINYMLSCREAALAVSQALLAAVNEGLGTALTSMNPTAVQALTKAPDNYSFMCAQLLGYSAESLEGGQRPREPFEVSFFDGVYGKPFKRDEGVVERLRDDGMIQDQGQPWRKEEVRGLAMMFDLPM
jgi:nitroreductase